MLFIRIIFRILIIHTETCKHTRTHKSPPEFNHEIAKNLNTLLTESCSYSGLPVHRKETAEESTVKKAGDRTEVMHDSTRETVSYTVKYCSQLNGKK